MTLLNICNNCINVISNFVRWNSTNYYCDVQIQNNWKFNKKKKPLFRPFVFFVNNTSLLYNFTLSYDFDLWPCAYNFFVCSMMFKWNYAEHPKVISLLNVVKSCLIYFRLKREVIKVLCSVIWLYILRSPVWRTDIFSRVCRKPTVW